MKHLVLFNAIAARPCYCYTGLGGRIDMTLSEPLQDIKGTPSSEIRPEVACLLVRGLAESSHAER